MHDHHVVVGGALNNCGGSYTHVHRMVVWHRGEDHGGHGVVRGWAMESWCGLSDGHAPIVLAGHGVACM
eukprot:4734278-Alexandrium_andersonii.AAC.1